MVETQHATLDIYMTGRAYAQAVAAGVLGIVGQPEALRYDRDDQAKLTENRIVQSMHEPLPDLRLPDLGRTVLITRSELDETCGHSFRAARQNGRYVSALALRQAGPTPFVTKAEIKDSDPQHIVEVTVSPSWDETDRQYIDSMIKDRLINTAYQERRGLLRVLQVAAAGVGCDVIGQAAIQAGDVETGTIFSMASGASILGLAVSMMPPIAWVNGSDYFHGHIVRFQGRRRTPANLTTLR